MDDILVVKSHSFIDVITNSSSELFVCDTKKSVGFVKSFLKRALDLYNDARIDEKEEYSDRKYEPLKYDDVFGNIYVIKSLKELKNIIGQYDGYRVSGSVGDLVVESNGDNSIPYGLFEFIEYSLNAERYHIG